MLTKTAPRRGSLGALRSGLLAKEDPAQILGAGFTLLAIALGWAGYLSIGVKHSCQRISPRRDKSSYFASQLFRAECSTNEYRAKTKSHLAERWALSWAYLS